MHAMVYFSLAEAMLLDMECRFSKRTMLIVIAVLTYTTAVEM